MSANTRIIDSTIGPLLLAASPDGLVRIAFQTEGFDRVRSGLAATHGALDSRPDPVADPILDQAADQLRTYLAGQTTGFDLTVSYSAVSDFRRRALAEIAKIPYGDTASYGQLAAAVGAPGAARAIGTACATNPVPLIVPCHRVVRSDGAAGQYLGGSAIKAELLKLERG